MKKLLFIFPLLLIFAILAGPEAGAETQAGGEIRNNATWTKDGSPYVLYRTVEIPNNVTLTIEPGVTITMDGAFDMFSVKGKIIAKGTAEEKIIFDGGGNSMFFNALNSTGLALVDLEYCEIRNGLALWKNGFGSFNLRYSLLENLSESSYLYFPVNDIAIEYNEFRQAAGFSIRQGGENRIMIRHNLFNAKHPNLKILDDYYIQSLASFENAQLIVEYNSFLNISGAVIKLYPGEIMAKMSVPHNYWGTTDTATIDAMIYDKHDDSATAGYVEYEPFLTTPHLDTPDIARPQAPAIDPVTTPTDSPAQVLSGVKPADTSVWLGSAEIVAMSPDPIWTYRAQLAIGENNFLFTVKDEDEVESRPTTITITRSEEICESFIYSDWGECANGLETRGILSALPEGCVGGEAALSRPCRESEEPVAETGETAVAREKRLQAQVNAGLSKHLQGRIVLQVEEMGEAWYIGPDDGKKYYLGRPADAFTLMRRLGLGATHEFISSHTLFPGQVLGKILLDVEQNGEAYYINPVDRKAYYLGRPHDAFRIMREAGLGITNRDLRQIGVGELR